MKGISTAAAAVLLATISITLVGTTYLFTSGIMKGAMAETFEVVDIFGNRVIVRNTGTEPIEKLKTLVDGKEVKNEMETIQPGKIGTVNITEGVMPGRHQLTLISESMSQTWQWEVEYVTTTTTPEEKLPPKVYGYIVQLKEEPILKKKVEIEKTISQMTKKGGIYIQEAETIQKELPSRLRDQKGRITSEHQTFLNKTSTVLKHPEEKIIREFKVVFNGIVLDISTSEAEELKKFEEVEGVYPNLEVKTTLMDSVPLINADDIWALGYTGQGVTIAIIDTGINYTHPDLGGCLGLGCKVIDGYDFVNDDSDPMDDNGHGTHCAGIAAANGTLKGVAPDANLIAYKVLNSGGGGWDDDIIAAIERALDPNQDGDYSDHVDVISISLGTPCKSWYGGYTENCGPNDSKSQAVDTAVENGVIVVVAAGNEGPDPETIRSPGTARKVITVGATYKVNYGPPFWWDCTPGEEIRVCGVRYCPDEGKVWCDYWGDGFPGVDQITSFSSRGPVVWNGNTITKPDVVAPGAIICSARHDDVYPAGVHPYYYPCFDEEHIQISGTSMATPHVAGAVALMIQAHPDWTPEMVKSALVGSAKDLGLSEYEQGGGRIDVLRLICPGDLNGDRVVDITDVIIPALVLGSSPGDSNWNPFADVTGDKIIDIADVEYVATQFGNIC